MEFYFGRSTEGKTPTFYYKKHNPKIKAISSVSLVVLGSNFARLGKIRLQVTKFLRESTGQKVNTL